MPAPASPSSALDIVVVPRIHDLGNHFEVRRVLPSQGRRMVGPFVFLDQMGPHQFLPGAGLDVRPHPHIGLATVTYLFSGAIEHRDSLGSRQAIVPGDLNWMSAGRGIVHSERTASALRPGGSSLFGLQSWVALPTGQEESEPSFLHTGAADLPLETYQGVSARIIAGSFFGRLSPVPTMSDLFYVDVSLQPGARLEIPADYAEQALYIVSGALDLGSEGVFEAGQMLVMGAGKRLALSAAGTAPARLILLGGERLAGPRYLWWNFVSSSEERIRQAGQDWRAQKFDPVPDDATEFIPLPELKGRPVRAQ